MNNLNPITSLSSYRFFQISKLEKLNPFFLPLWRWRDCFHSESEGGAPALPLLAQFSTQVSTILVKRLRAPPTCLRPCFDRLRPPTQSAGRVLNSELVTGCTPRRPRVETPRQSDQRSRCWAKLSKNKSMNL